MVIEMDAPVRAVTGYTEAPPEASPQAGDGPMDVLDVIEDWELGYNLGCAVKAIREGDLPLARYHLDREIARRSP